MAKSTVWTLTDLERKGYRLVNDAPQATPVALTLVLPWPPTMNHLHAVQRGRKVLSEAGVEYHRQVGKCVLEQRQRGWHPLTGRLHLVLEFHAPYDRYDIGNFLKCLEDALTNAGVWRDDRQNDHIELIRAAQSETGYVAVLIEPLKVRG